MKNKNFKDLVEDYFKLGLISSISQKKLNQKYDNADDSVKGKMDEYSQVILDDYLWWYYKELDKNPSSPINNFITNNLSEISFLKVWQQVIIKKID